MNSTTLQDQKLRDLRVWAVEIAISKYLALVSAGKVFPSDANLILNEADTLVEFVLTGGGVDEDESND